MNCGQEELAPLSPDRLRRVLGRAGARKTSRKPRRARKLVEWWTKEELALLGSDSDDAIAHRLGRRVSQVRSMRQRRKIPSFGLTKRFWTSDEDRLVGQISDAELAARLKRTLESVRKRRIERGLPPYDPKCRPWTEEELSLLGKEPDPELARRFGRTTKAIRHQRRKQGLAVPLPSFVHNDSIRHTYDFLHFGIGHPKKMVGYYLPLRSFPSASLGPPVRPVPILHWYSLNRGRLQRPPSEWIRNFNRRIGLLF